MKIAIVENVFWKSLGLVLLCLWGSLVLQANAANQDSSVPEKTSDMTKAELTIWNDPLFQKHFQDSYTRETDIEPRVTVTERDQMQEVLDLISSDKLGEAAAVLEGARNPAASAVFDFTLANIYFQQEDLDKAAIAYKNAVEKFPKFRRAWRNLALIHVRQGEFKKALPALTSVIKLGGKDSITYGLLGFAYSSKGDYISAESAYRTAILLDDKTTDWKLGLARCFFKQQRYEEAIAICSQLIDADPDCVDFWFLQANAYIGLKKPLKAAEIYELIDQLGKSTPESLNMLGDIYINEELYGMAADCYVRSMESATTKSPDRAIRSAKILAARSAFEETKLVIETAEQIYADSLEKDQQKDLLKLKARLAVASGEGDEEARVLEQIVAIDPLDGEALILLGDHSSRAGDTEKAANYYGRAAEIEKYEADAKVRHAQLLVKTGKYEEAIPLLKRAQMLKPRDNVQTYLEQVERVAK